MREVIIACDFSSKEETLKFLSEFNDEKLFLKIGMELFYSTGMDFVKYLKECGHKVFLDLKLHDIPNTVYKAMKVVALSKADIINVHAGGTIEMMKAAQKAIDEVSPDSILIAVTQLTSTSEEVMQKELLINNTVVETVKKYAQNAKEAGLKGVVCSPLEVELVKEACGNDFVTVTPGIRFADNKADDQKRITTPARAKEIGSDYIVVGRPITAAEDPVVAYKRCVEEYV